MARIRTIKPEFWTDAKTGTLSEMAKCLFLGILNHADDYGVATLSIPEWRAKVFPYHSVSTHGVLMQVLTDELLARGLLIAFSHTAENSDPQQYVWVKNFERHQIVNRPSKPLLSGWKKNDTPETYAKRAGIEYCNLDGSSLKPSVSTHGALTEHSLQEGKGKEGKGEEDSPPACASGLSVSTNGRYAFESGVIRLTQKDFDRWKAAFNNLNLAAELESCATWAGQQTNWFQAVSALLGKRNREAKAKIDLELAKGSTPKQHDPWDGIL
jgi:hypothetical protein